MMWDMQNRIHFEQWVPFPLAPVFLFFANPLNLPRIMPPAAGTRLLDMKLIAPPGGDGLGLAGAGSRIVTSFRVSPYLFARAEWIAEITEFEWNRRFADEQRSGPFAVFQHWHEFDAEDRNGVPGTLVRDRIAYDVGFGGIGKLADKLFVRRQLQKTFAYRQRALAGILGEAAQ
jgi:ligand-binding SRPBCC domain-containing protein